MGADTKIEWAHHTFNPWVGCTKVSPACDHCYAEGWAKRTGQARLWQGERRQTSPAYWRQPFKWNREAQTSGIRKRVFCASLADVFDNQVPVEWRADLWELIGRCRNLDWLLLTKRPQNIAKMLPVMDSAAPGYKPWNEKWPWPNVWLGTTVENQEEADRRIPLLLDTPAAKRFISAEPLLGPVNLDQVACLSGDPRNKQNALTRAFHIWGETSDGRGPLREILVKTEPIKTLPHLDWVIAGGESGPNARPMHPDWAKSLRDQCTAAGVAFFYKQHGEWTPDVTPHIPVPPDRLRHVRDDGLVATATEVEKIEWREGHQNWKQIARVGKAKAGRLLDGRTWDEFPA